MPSNQLEDNFVSFVNKIREFNPDISNNSFSGLIISIISTFRKSMDDINENEITWERPYIKIEYSIGIDSNGKEFLFNHKIDKNIIEKAIEKNYIDIFKTITKNITMTWKDDYFSHDLPESFIKKLEKISPNKHLAHIEKYLLTESLVIKPEINKPALIIKFNPLKIDNNKKYFSVIANIEEKEFKLSRWKDKSKNEFWNSLISNVSKITNDDFTIKYDSISKSLPINNIKPVDIKNKLIKTSLHTELQKFGKKPKNKQSSIFDLLDNMDDETKKDIIKYQINVIGIDNTQSQNQSLFAVQKLLHETGYNGNTDIKKIAQEENSFKFNGYLPSVKFTPSEYLDAYGLNKKITTRGKAEYNANERIEALKALRELSQKRYLFFYERKYWKDGKELYDIIKTVRPLFNITEGYESLDSQERNILQSKEEGIEEKLKYIVIEPCPILVDQLNSYFVLKPANCYQEIRLLVGKTSKYVPLFIDYLRAEVTKREISSKGKKEIEWIIEINYETLAYKLRMDKLIKDHKTKKIKLELDKCYKIAQQLGYLNEYNTVSGINIEVEKLVLNPEKFKRVKEIDNELKKINSEIENKSIAESVNILSIN